MVASRAASVLYPAFAGLIPEPPGHATTHLEGWGQVQGRAAAARGAVEREKVSSRVGAGYWDLPAVMHSLRRADGLWKARNSAQ